MSSSDSAKASFHLASNQHDVWIEQLLHPDSPLYNIGAGFRIDGPVNVDFFEQALHQVVRENDALRLSFSGEGADVRQRVLPRVNFQVPLLDFSTEPDADARALAWIHERMSKPLSMLQAPLFRFALIRTAPDRYHWYQCYHHLIADGITTTLIANRLEELYAALAAGDRLPDKAGFSYLDHVLDDLAYRESDSFDNHREYWLARLESVPEPLFSEGAAPAEGGPNTRRTRMNITREQYKKLQVIAHDSGAGVQHIFLAGMYHCFAGYGDRTANAPLSIGLTLHNRRTKAFKQTMGMFAAITPFYYRLDPRKSIGAQLKDLAAMQRRDYRRARFPAGDMSRALDADGAGVSRLFDVTLSFETRAYGESLAGAPLSINRIYHEAEVNPLAVFVLDYQEDHDVAVDFIWNRCFFQAAYQIEGLIERLKLFLDHLCKHPDAPFGRVPRMRLKSRNHILAQSQGPQLAVSAPTVIDMIRERAVCYGHTTAMDAPAMTYRELMERVDELAVLLVAKGLKPQAVAAVHLDLSPGFNLAMLAIMRAGGIALPMDPDWPLDRRAYCITDSQARMVITDRDADEYNIQVIAVSADGDFAPVSGPTPPSPFAEMAAYTMYTSGSTGRPKGVTISHAALASFVTGALDMFQFKPHTRALQYSSPGFDVILFEMCAFFAAGITVIPTPVTIRMDPGRLTAFLQKQHITFLQMVPSMLAQLMEVPRFQELNALEICSCAGEAVSPALRNRFGLVQQAALYNCYGPTEACVITTKHLCRRVERRETTPIGFPFPNTALYLLDRSARPVHGGEVGEIFIGGSNLSSGYVGRPDLTAHAFIPDPFSGEGGRLYRTGDLGRRRRDGALVYLGRRDFQVKLRGQRIEPGEIESVICLEPGISQAVVAVVDGRLVAWLVMRDGVDLDELRTWLATRLTAAMVPSDWVVLDELPVGASGKVNYHALPKPAAPVRQTRISANPTLELIRGLVGEVLKLGEVAAEDDFFRLGGSSLDAMRVQAGIRDQFQVEVPIMILFGDATVFGIARAVEQAFRKGEGLTRAPAAVRGPGSQPSFAQERLWYLNRLNGPAYHIPFVLHFQHRPDPIMLAAGITAVCRRHHVLCTRYPDHRGKPALRIIEDPPVRLEPVLVNARDRDSRLAWFAAQPFDLAFDSPLRCQLTLVGDRMELWLTLHHIVFDGPSLALLLSELFQVDTPPPTLQYADWAARHRAWMQGPVLERELDYWRERLNGAVAVLELPLDFPRGDQAPAARHDFIVPSHLSRLLREVVSQRGATPVVGLQTVFALLLSRYSDQTDLLLGVPVTNRDRRELDGVIGCFLNTIAVRYRFEDAGSFDQVLREARRAALADYTHRDAPFEKVVDLPGLDRRLGISPLFQVLFAFVDARLPDLPAGVSLETIAPAMAKFDLSLEMSDDGDHLHASLEYNAALFRPATISQFARHFNNLLENLLNHPEQAVGDVPFLDRDEREFLLVTLNQTGVTAGVRLPWFVQFETHAARESERVALIHGVDLDQTMTYGALNHRADQLAFELHQSGVRPGDRVAVCRRRGPGMLYALLAVLKTGAAYIPLDPEHPAERLEMILEDAAPCLILSDRGGPLVDCGIPQRYSDEDPNPIMAHHFHDRRVSLDHTAYIIYTSGSTGRPKGVAVSHAALANFLHAMAFSPGLTEDDTLLAVTTVAFDIAALELYLPLRSGGRLALGDRAISVDGQRLAEVLDRPGFITVMQATPATWRLLSLTGAAPKLKMLCGGEALPGDLAATLLTWGGSLWNLYGPTETTVWSTIAPITSESALDKSALSIGRAIDNTRIHILNHRLQLMPPGVPGALHIGGKGLAQGYVGQPALTAQRFLPNPFGTTPGDRLYDTGDVVKLAPSGDLIYLGRNDFQIKLRGFRIEPGDIEAHLLAMPEVDEALVVLRGDSDPYLAAYVVLNAEPAEPLLEALERELPAYMTPSRLMVLDALPLNTSGKVNRAALPEPRREGGRGAASPMAAMILDIFASVLDRDDLDGHDDFFRSGGHSLNAIQVLARINESLGVSLSPRTLFLYSSAADLALQLERERFSGPRIAPPEPIRRQLGDSFPMTFGQERLWFVEVMDGAGGAHHVPARLHFSGDLNVDLLFQCLEQIAARHEILHAAVIEQEGVPGLMLVKPPRFDRTPVTADPAEIDNLIREWTSMPFAPGRPMIRARLIRVSPTVHQLVVVLHHLVTDAWSGGVLLRELTALYAALHAGRPSPLKPPALQFGDYAVWQRKSMHTALNEQLEWWVSYLHGARHFLDLPLDQAYPQTSALPGDCLHFQMDDGCVNRLECLSPTLAPALQAVFACLLARYADVDDVVVGTPFTNRETRAQESMIGFFLNTLPMRYRCGSGVSLHNLMDQVRSNILDAYSRRAVPFEKLVEAVQPERRGERHPLFQVTTTHLEGQPSTGPWPGLNKITFETPRHFSRFELSLYTERNADGLFGAIEFRNDLFDRATIEAMVRHFKAFLKQTLANPNRELSQISFLDEEERANLLQNWNQPAGPVSPYANWLDGFYRWAERDPDRPALYHGESLSDMLTYGRLASRIDALAAYLQRQGFGPGVTLAVYHQRSAELVIAMAACSRLGCTYVPLDPGHPPKRNAVILADARPAAILTGWKEDPPHWSIPLIRPVLDHKRETTTFPKSDPDLIAYTIYTSGSTGRPKGVSISHGSLLNLLTSMADQPGLNQHDHLLAVTTPAFDIAGLELYLPLFVGACLSVAPSAWAADPDRLGAVLASGRHTVMQATPATWTMLVSAGRCPNLKILCGGEALSADLAARLIQPDGELWNLYGPTETTIWSTRTLVTAEMLEGERGAVHIGRPIDGTSLHILDQNLQLMPVGLTGDLYIGGVGLALGYRERRRLTAANFIPHPSSDTPGARIYRTGDRARVRRDGRLVYMGRSDFQIKLRGFRIEPGEIESALRDHPNIDQAAVVVKRVGDQDALVAYLVHEHEFAEGNDPRSFISKLLPNYMTPAFFVSLAELPLNANGKLDRGILPDPEIEQDTDAGMSPAEALMAAIWSDVLGVALPSRQQNFFEMGGQSLAATRVAARVRSGFGVEMNVRDLFEAPTPALLCNLLESRNRSGGPVILKRVPDQASWPLSSAQSRIWLDDQLIGGQGAYHLARVWELHAKVSKRRLRRALTRLVARHEILRTRIINTDEGPRAVVGEGPDPILPIVEVQDVNRVNTVIENIINQPFRLESEAPIRCLLYLVGGVYRLVMVLHHVAVDGWSAGVMLRELTELYDSDSDYTQPAAYRYVDFSMHHLAKWADANLIPRLRMRCEALAVAPALQLPLDFQGEPEGCRGAVHSFQLDERLCAAIREQARELDCTVSMYLTAVYGAFLARLTGQDRLVIGLPSANRDIAAAESVVGCFINNMPLLLDPKPKLPFSIWTANVRRETLAVHMDRDAPYEDLVPRSGSPLIQTLFQITPGLPPFRLLGEALADFTPVISRVKMDLLLEMEETETHFNGAFFYRSDRFKPQSIQRAAVWFQTLLAHAVAAPETELGRLQLADNPALLRQLADWNAVSAPSRANPVRAVLAHAKAPLGLMAVTCGKQTMTYAQLGEKMDDLARRLPKIRPDGLIGVCLPRDLDLLPALFAVWRRGFAFVPLDPALPKARLLGLLGDVDLLISRRDVLDEQISQDCNTPLFWLDEENAIIDKAELVMPLPQSVAYVLHTSGSTGRPKGVMIGHRALSDYLSRAVTNYGLSQGSGAPVFGSIGFDATLTSLLAPLVTGKTVVMVPENNPEVLCDLLFEGDQFSMIKLTPAHLDLLARLRGGNLNIRAAVVVLGGEALHEDRVAPWLKANPKTQFFNEYGPTEATVGATLGAVEADLPVTIGRPFANTRTFAVDSLLNPVPLGIAGELLIGGAGLAMGYHNRPMETAKRFIPDPFGGKSGERLYRSGDLVRFNDDGVLVFLGRIDHQVKIRGYRVELGEIEAALMRLPGVSEALVRNNPQQLGLTAWVIADDFDVAQARAILAEELPDYMIPSAFVRLESFPLTVNGKINTAALPQPDRGENSQGKACTTITQRVLAEIFSAVLNRTIEHADADFLGLGGNSLAAARVVAAVRDRLGVILSLRDMFVHTTPAALASLIEDSDSSAVPLVACVGSVPLSLPQTRLWLLDQLEGTLAYHVFHALELTGPLDLPALQAAFAAVVGRHQILHTCFKVGEDGPAPQLFPPDRIQIETRTLSSRKMLRDELAGLRDLPFDLTKGPLIRISLLRLDHLNHVLAITMHHMISDGWSMGVMTAELNQLYAVFLEGKPADLPALKIQYGDFAAWQMARIREGEWDAQINWWRERLDGAPTVLEPFHQPHQDHPHRAVGSCPVVITEPLVRAVTDLAQSVNGTPFMCLLAAYGLLLSRYAGVDDLLIGIPEANRTHAALEPLIGFFVNTLPVRCRLDDEVGVSDYLASVRDGLLGDLAHRDVPFEKLVEIMNVPRDTEHHPLFQVMFSFWDRPVSELELPGVGVKPLKTEPAAAKYDLLLNLTAVEGCWEGAWEYNTSRFHADAVNLMNGHFLNLLQAMVDQPGRPVHALQMLSADQRQVLLDQWCEPESMPAPLSVLRLIQERIRYNADDTAVIMGSKRFSFAELGRQAGVLSTELRRLGVGPERVVGLYMSRSPQMVVGLVAILQTGAAWLPLDPAQPQRRLSFMIEDAAAHLILTDNETAALTPNHVQSINLEPFDFSSEVVARVSYPDPEQAAYIIHTSGSTGNPKGVVVSQWALANHMMWMAGAFPLSNHDRVLHKTPISFDACIWELLAPLMSGAVLVLAPKDAHRDAAVLTAAMIEHRVTRLQLVPTLLAHLLEEPAFIDYGGLSHLFCGGETLTPDLRNRCLDLLNVALVNLYGPTEVCIDATFHRCGAGSSDVPIGLPISGNHAFVLDGQLEPVPVGVVGELYLAGSGLARGYRRRPDLTARAFIPNPFGDKPGSRLYRTGDLARGGTDGAIHFEGRSDFQIKLRGLRMEPAEIEAALTQHNDVLLAAVTVANQQLVAYLQLSQAGAEEADFESHLRRHLRKRLPEFMLPTLFIVLEQMPLNNSGKVSRRALPPVLDQSTRAHVAPRNQTEEYIADLWRRVLDREGIGVEDSFFDVGGHSLPAVRILTRLRTDRGVDLSLRAFFEAPTIADLAKLVEAEEVAGSSPPLEGPGEDEEDFVF